MQEGRTDTMNGALLQARSMVLDETMVRTTRTKIHAFKYRRTWLMISLVVGISNIHTPLRTLTRSTNMSTLQLPSFRGCDARRPRSKDGKGVNDKFSMHEGSVFF